MPTEFIKPVFSARNRPKKGLQKLASQQTRIGKNRDNTVIRLIIAERPQF
jgi:hypothetical protein